MKMQNTWGQKKTICLYAQCSAKKSWPVDAYHSDAVWYGWTVHGMEAGKWEDMFRILTDPELPEVSYPGFIKRSWHETLK